MNKLMTVNFSENMLGADNQQERLIKIGWIIGFVDGEGCFSCGIIGQPDRVNRKGYKTGYQVFHEFAVTQGEKSLSCLQEIHDFFKVGNVYVNKRYDNHKEHLQRYVVRSRKDLLETIIPFFIKFPLRSSKRNDFDKFVQCMEIVKKDHHLTHSGLADLLEISQTMNRCKSRNDLVRILRDYTPNIQDIG